MIFSSFPRSRVLLNLWSPEKVRIEFYDNPGWHEGAILALTRALEGKWFDAYDWIIRINPDVIIRDERFLLDNMLDKDVDGIFASCYRNNCTAGCTGNLVHTDFFAVRPRILLPKPVVVHKDEELVQKEHLQTWCNRL